MSALSARTRELTGKHVLFCLVGFFAVVFAVNAVMMRAATSTFGGVETASSYKAGLMFEQDSCERPSSRTPALAGRRQARAR